MYKALEEFLIANITLHLLLVIILSGLEIFRSQNNKDSKNYMKL